MTGGGSLTPSQQHAAILASLSPVIWGRLRETSGTNAVNYGSLGALGDGTWTPGAGAVGQTGQLGANEAYLWDGATSKIAIPARTGYNNLATYTWGLLCKPAAQSHLMTASLGAGRYLRMNSASFPLQFVNTSSATPVTSTTANGFLALNVWQYFFVTFDNAGDRKARIYKYVAGALTEATYVTQDAMTGTIVSPADALWIGATTAGTFLFNGPIDEYFICPSVLSTVQMAQLGAAAGLT